MSDLNVERKRDDVGRKNLLVGLIVLTVILLAAFFIVETKRDSIGPRPAPPADVPVEAPTGG